MSVLPFIKEIFLNCKIHIKFTIIAICSYKVCVYVCKHTSQRIKGSVVEGSAHCGKVHTRKRERGRKRGKEEKGREKESRN